ncbi:MAG: Asp-tRNA(Asn)/Glu-tRNA(Gln) amidotransferase subunit GatC [Candidatus Marsarchaeota archaeon]|jgi:aspartyl/glutamyl-tRNA(Asn/Gln) amidotransferase C subunit|nr:Asp-tRNA(Asn)/Glu-tRNA(Gln) amidotransferase subunit GatC [Candidatus Marsarchaeota archaeon]
MVDFQKVDATLLERICSDAKLTLDDSEKERFVTEMSEILAAFRSIGEAETEGVRPAYHPTAVENVWRDDAPARKRKIDIKKNTDALEGGYIVGPKLV